MVLPDLQIGHNRAMYASFIRVFLPGGKVLLNLDLPDPVQRHNVKLPHRFVVLRRISGRYNHKALRQMMCAKGFVLQKLQHGRCQCLRDAVDFIQKQDSLLYAAFLNLIIYRGNDFTHGILSDRGLLSSILLFGKKRKADRALPRMVRNGVGNQIDPALSCSLLHDGCLADSGRPDQKERTLLLHGNQIFPHLIFLCIGPNGADHLLLCFLNVHAFRFVSFHTVLVIFSSQAAAKGSDEETFPPRSRILSTAISRSSSRTPCPSHSGAANRRTIR